MTSAMLCSRAITGQPTEIAGIGGWLASDAIRPDDELTASARSRGPVAVAKYTHGRASCAGNMGHRVRVFAARADTAGVSARNLTERAGFEPAMGL